MSGSRVQKVFALFVAAASPACSRATDPWENPIVGEVNSTQFVRVKSQGSDNVETFQANIDGVGLLLSKCLVLTAYHVALGNTRPGEIPRGTTSLLLYRGVDSKARVARASLMVINAVIVAHGLSFMSARKGDLGDDWAILKLDHCVSTMRPPWKARFLPRYENTFRHVVALFPPLAKA